MNFTIKSYEELEKLYRDLEIDFCDKCDGQTIHIKRGYKGNVKCLKCEENNGVK